MRRTFCTPCVAHRSRCAVFNRLLEPAVCHDISRQTDFPVNREHCFGCHAFKILLARQDCQTADINRAGADHKLIGAQLIATLKLIGEKAPEIVHFEFVSLPEGSMSTRAGKFVSADELIEEVTRRAYEEVTLRRLPMDPTAFSTDELQWSPYDFSALAVFSVPVDPTLEPNPDDVQPNRLEWPFGDVLGEAVQPEGWRKIVVAEDMLDDLRPVLGQATQITIWTVGDREYNLYFRPLLPDEA